MDLALLRNMVIGNGAAAPPLSVPTMLDTAISTTMISVRWAAYGWRQLAVDFVGYSSLLRPTAHILSAMHGKVATFAMAARSRR